jgi:hypothetical protein
MTEAMLKHPAHPSQQMKRFAKVSKNHHDKASSSNNLQHTPSSLHSEQQDNRTTK